MGGEGRLVLDIGISKVSIHRNLGGKLSLVYRYVEFSISYNDRPFIHSKIKSSSYLHAGISCVLDIVSKFRYIGISFFSTHGHGGKGLVLDIGTGEKNGISENKKTIYRNIEKDDIPIWGGGRLVLDIGISKVSIHRNVGTKLYLVYISIC